MMIIFVVISAIVAKLNRLLDQLNVSSRLKTVADIGAGVFVTLFEGLCGEQLPGRYVNGPDNFKIVIVLKYFSLKLRLFSCPPV